jgi:hypothetical protein
MEGIVVAILVSVVTGILIFVSQGIYNKYFVLQPKIIIRVLGKNSGYRGPIDKQTYRALWTPTIEFLNNSKHDAYNLKIFYLNADVFKKTISKPLYFKDHEFIKGFEKKSIFLEREKSIPKKSIINFDKVLNDFMPDDIKNLSFLITYENEKGKRFYTEFKNDKAKTFKRKRKKFRKYLS